MEKVAALAPTHALVNVDETPKQMADSLAAQGIAVIVTHPIEVADNRRLFELIGGLFDRPRRRNGLSQRSTPRWPGWTVVNLDAAPSISFGKTHG